MDFRSQKSINIKSCHANFEGKTASECIFCEFSTFTFLSEVRSDLSLDFCFRWYTGGLWSSLETVLELVLSALKSH